MAEAQVPKSWTGAAEAGADLLFSPDAAAMYGDGYQTFVAVEQVAKPLEGALRPIHFRGVATVVLKFSTYRKLDPPPWEESVFYDHPSGRTRIWESMRWKAGHLSDPDVMAGPISPQ